MSVEYRWFKNGKEFMYTLDLEGDQVTKEFWDNGNVKLEIRHILDNYSEPEIIRNYKSGNRERHVYIEEDRISINDYDDDEQNSIHTFQVVFTKKNPLEGWRRSYSDKKPIAEPTSMDIRDMEYKDFGGIKINWFSDKDAFLNDYCPESITYDSNGNVKRLNYDVTNVRDVLISTIRKTPDAITVIYQNGIYFECEDESELSQLPKDVFDEYFRLMKDFEKMKDHYYKKYFEGIFNDEDVATLLSIKEKE